MSKVYIATLTSGIWSFKTVSPNYDDAINALVRKAQDLNEQYEGMNHKTWDAILDSCEVRAYNLNEVYVNDRFTLTNGRLTDER